jgi:hypothetical protein
MAERRMFAKSIVLSDAFLDMPMSSRCLYFTLGMLADDEGFIGSPKSIMRQCGASQDDLMMLINKRYIIDCGDGVIVIKHWRLNNYLQKDRIKETTYVKEKGQLTITENGSYTERDKQCIQNVYIDKNSIEKNSIDKNNIRHKYGEYQNVLLSDEDMEKLKTEFPDWKERIERVSTYCASTGKSYKNYLATIRNWARKDKPVVVDELPTYNTRNNAMMSEEDEKEILELMKKG